MLICPRCSSLFVSDVRCCGLDGERLVEVDRDPLLGATVDRYRITDTLGEGGMGRVYRAQHLHLGHTVALKVLHGDTASDRRQAERFRREAKSAAQIRHPNVVEVTDFGVSASGQVFMAMELLEGTTLAERVAERGRLELVEIAEIVRQTALGLAAAHRFGFVHRDLKPKNLTLVGEGERLRVVILDFGLVRVLDDTDPRLTAHGQVYGTPAYMAPEQITDGVIDARTDLYALGVILYELLAGRRPFAGALGDVLDKHKHGQAAQLDDRTGLGALAHALMAKAPADRPSCADEVVAHIEALRLGPALRSGAVEARLRMVEAEVDVVAEPTPTPTPTVEVPVRALVPARAATSRAAAGETTSLRPGRTRRAPDGHEDAVTEAIVVSRRAAVDPDEEQASLDAMVARAKPAWPALMVSMMAAAVALTVGYPWLASSNDAVIGVASMVSPVAEAEAGELPDPVAPQRADERVTASAVVRARAPVAASRAKRAPAPTRTAERGGRLLPRLPRRGSAVVARAPEGADPDEPAESRRRAPVTEDAETPPIAALEVPPPLEADAKPIAAAVVPEAVPDPPAALPDPPAALPDPPAALPDAPAALPDAPAAPLESATATRASAR